MPSSYEQHGRSFGEPEQEPLVYPYKTYKEAHDAGFFESAKQDKTWILMDPPENSRNTKPIKLKIIDFQPRRQALGLDKAKSNIIDISSSKKEDIVPIGETEGGSRIPISGDNGRNFRRMPQETTKK